MPTTIFAESFEADGNGTRYITSIPEFSDGSGDFFFRTDGSNTGAYNLAGGDGSFYFAAQDINGEGASATQTLSFTGIDIASFSNLSFQALFAEDDASDGNEDWDAPDQFFVEYQIDGGGFQKILAFENAGATFNTVPAQDTDFDGVGEGTQLTDIFTNFTAAIADAGSNLDLRLTFVLDAEDEDIAIDNIQIMGDGLVNSAPVLSGGATFTGIDKNVADAANQGTTVADLVSGLITDADFDPQGIAITAIDSTNGTWQYSTDGGSNWQALNGAIADNNAITLGATSLYTPALGTAPDGQTWLSFTNLVGAIQTVDASGTTLDTTANQSIYAGYSNFGAGGLVNPSFPTLDHTLGYEIAFDMQLLAESRTNQSRAGFSIVAVSQDTSKAIEIGFQSTSATTGNIFAQGGPTFMAAENVAFNTNEATQYTLAVAGDSYTLLADGAQILTGALRDYTAFMGAIDPYETPNFVFLGDDTTSAQGSFLLSQVAVSTETRVRFVPNADYVGDATVQFRAWDTTDGAFNGKTGVDASQNGGLKAFSNGFNTGTITVTEPLGVTPPPPGPSGSATGLVFTYKQFIQFQTLTGNAPAFDEELYLFANPDVKAALEQGEVAISSGAEHYRRFGIKEGRSLVPLFFEVGQITLADCFDETYYLSTNDDVVQAIAQGAFSSGFEHFLQFGLNEGRNLSRYYNETLYLETYADVKAAVAQGVFSSGLEHYLQIGHIENRVASGLFNAPDYLLNNLDVKAAVDRGEFVSAFEHFVEIGAHEGRLSVLLFEEATYRQQNPDVAQVVGSTFVSGFEHYVSFGQQEQRNPSAAFDESVYLSLHLDVAAAVSSGFFASGMEHYFRHGQGENRALS